MLKNCWQDFATLLNLFKGSTIINSKEWPILGKSNSLNTLLFSPLFKHASRVYRVTTVFTAIAALFDGLNAIPFPEHAQNIIISMVDFAKAFIPLFSIGMGWLVPALIGFIIGLIWEFLANKVKPSTGLK